MCDGSDFKIESIANPQNDRISAANKKQVIPREKLIERTEHPTSTMAWGGITSNGKAPAVFVDAGVKINK